MGSGCPSAILPLDLLPAGPSAGSFPACTLFSWEAVLAHLPGPSSPLCAPRVLWLIHLRVYLAQVARQQGRGCPALPAGKHLLCTEGTYDEDITCDSSQILHL